MKRALWTLLGCCAALHAQTPQPGQNFPWALSSGAWSFFTDPRAVYYKGQREKAYMGAIDRQSNVRVWSYDFGTSAVDSFSLKNIADVDDHDAPALYVHVDGRITAIYQRHTLDRSIYLRTTVNPEDIRTWGAERSLTGVENTTYAHPIRLSRENNRVYLFNREVDWHPTVRTSDNEGTTWSAPRQFIGGPAARPYIKYQSDGQSRIHFAFTDGHPRDVANNSIYYGYYEGGNFRRADGSLIKAFNSPLEPTEAERVYNGATGGGRAWIWDVALDSLGRPVLAFVVAPTESNHRYYYARWNGSQWLVRNMGPGGRWFPQTPANTSEREPHYSGGIILNPQDPSEAFLSRPPNGTVGGVFEIERWVTSDLGATWTTQAVTSGSNRNNIRPIVPWPANGQRHARRLLFWMHGDYIHYTNYSTGIKYSFQEPTVSLRGPAIPDRSRAWLSFGERAMGYNLLGRIAAPGAGPEAYFVIPTPQGGGL